MTGIQYHRPLPFETLTDAGGKEHVIEKVWYETRREVFRVTWLDPDAPEGKRGCQIMRGENDEWVEWEPEAYANLHG